MTITGDNGTADVGTGGTGGISFVDCARRAFVFGAETTRRSHRVAADPFDGVLSLLSSGDGGGMSCFRLGVLGIVPDVLSFDSEGDNEEDPIDWSLEVPIPKPLYRSCFPSTLVGLLSLLPALAGFEKNRALNPPNAEPGERAPDGC